MSEREPRRNDGFEEQIFRGEVKDTNVEVPSETAKFEKAAQLRSEIAQTQQGIDEITASIEQVVASIQAGQKLLQEQGGNEALASIHAKLGARAQAEKITLLAEKAKLETTLQGIENSLQILEAPSEKPDDEKDIDYTVDQITLH